VLVLADPAAQAEEPVAAARAGLEVLAAVAQAGEVAVLVEEAVAPAAEGNEAKKPAFVTDVLFIR
jgi:hypothetical protein